MYIFSYIDLYVYIEMNIFISGNEQINLKGYKAGKLLQNLPLKPFHLITFFFS